MSARLATGLALLAITKIAFRYALIGAFTPVLVQVFSIVDAAAIVILTPWASMGRPLPRRNRIYRRALLVAFVSTLVLALVNLLLQVPLIYYGSTDTLEALLRILFEALPRSFFISPLGGLAVMLLASAVGWAWLKLRLPRTGGAGGRARPGGSARAGVGARTAAGGRGGRAPSAPGGRRPRSR
ncbi:MAG TPA: hypothetical protein VGL23_17570 [Chloroflexota bacterium]|jgi:hypothetical protein